MPAKAATEFQSIEQALSFISKGIASAVHTISIHTYQPHDKQVAFHSDNNSERSKPNKTRLYIGGNRSGKTVGGIIEDLYWVRKKHPYFDLDALWPEPIRGRIVTVDFKNGWEKIIQPMLKAMIPASELLGGSWDTAWDKQTYILNFANGGFIEIMSYDQDLDKFAGTSRHFVHFDEEPPEDIYNECKARLVDTGGCLWFTMTPVDGMTWIYDSVYEPGVDGSDPTTTVIEVSMFDNPHINTEEKQAFSDGLSEDERKARVEGKFVQRGGLIYPKFDERVHVIDESVPSKNYLWGRSLDHGYRNPTAWLWHAVNHEGRIITFYEHYKSGLIISDHAKAVHEIDTMLGKVPEIVVGDPSIRNTDPITGTSIFEEYAKLGIYIEHGHGLNEFRVGQLRVAGYIETHAPVNGSGEPRPFWIVTRNCTNLIWEIQRYRWRTFKQKQAERDNNAPEQPQKKNDHACDSLRYFIMTRPELRLGLENAEQMAANPLGTPSTYTWGNPKRDVDPELVPRQTNWSLDYYDGKTEWQTEEYMGAEW